MIRKFLMGLTTLVGFALPIVISAKESAPLSLTILHINDHHSHLEPDQSANLKLNGKSTRVEIGGFSRVVQKFKELEQGKSNVIKIHAGDAMTGDLYYTLFQGAADAALMNEVCFDFFVLGNHEFDSGDLGSSNF